MIDEYYAPTGENVNEVLETRELFQIIFNKKVSKNNFIPVFIVFSAKSKSKFESEIKKLKDNNIKILDIYYWKIPDTIENLRFTFITQYEKSEYAHNINQDYDI